MLAQARRLLLRGRIVLLAIQTCLLAVASVRADEPPSLDAIRASLEKQRDQVKSLYIEVKGYSTLSVDAKVLASWPQFSHTFAPFEQVNHFAFKGGKRYARQLCPSTVKRLAAEQPPKIDPKASPEEQAIAKQRLEDYLRHEKEKARWKRMGQSGVEENDPMVARLCPDDARADDGRVQWERRTMDGKRHEVFVMRHEPKRQWVHIEWYLSCIGWNCDTKANTQDEWALEGARNSLVNVIRSGAFTLSKETVVLDGSKCVLLERELVPKGPQAKYMVAGKSSVWLDVEHGFAVRQTELRQKNGDLQRTVNSDFVQILPGVWFARKSEQQSFAPPDAPKEHQGRPVRTFHSELTKWIVNEVPDELFDVPIKSGDDVHDLRLNDQP
jgi:hypothetical protein